MPNDAIADPMREGQRILTICNACRYCEGFCAVFPAMERRTHFTAGDVNYLANLCHGCSECYYACQYAPPHEFAVNVPKTLAQIRVRSYRQYAWPKPIGQWLAVVTLVINLFVGIAGAKGNANPADFYGVISHGAMAGLFGVVSLLVLVALIGGLLRFWRESGERLASLANATAPKSALADAFTLKYLRGEPRSWFHHLTFYGFLLCFASTTVAAFYHYALRRIAPYGYMSVPVIVGTVGGIALVVGTSGLFAVRQRQDAAIRDPEQDGMSTGFVALLFAASSSGLLLLAMRETWAMPRLLVVHLAIVLAFFASLPYGKFVHGIYRLAALLRYALERSRAD